MFPLETRILVADDMMAICDLIKMHLKLLGFENVTTANDGKQVIDLLNEGRQWGKSIELLICDWNMPIKTGIEILEYVRAHKDFEKIPFIMITSENDRKQVARAILEGVNHYIVKPFTSKTLKERLTSVYERL